MWNNVAQGWAIWPTTVFLVACKSI